MSKNIENWLQHYEELKEYVRVNGLFPDKHRVEFLRLLNWAKYTRKRIKAGTLPEEHRTLFEELYASRSDEHTGGRRKKTESELPDCTDLFSTVVINAMGQRVPIAESTIHSAVDYLIRMYW